MQLPYNHFSRPPRWPFTWHPRAPGTHAVYPMLGPETLRDVTLRDTGAGTLEADAALVADAGGHYVVTCDGSGDYVRYSKPAPFFEGTTPSFSLAVWLQINTGASSNHWIWSLGYTSSTTPIVGLINELGSARGFYRVDGGASVNLVDPADLDVGTWRHVAATGDGTTVRLYVDGAEVNNGSQSAGAITLDTLSACALRRSTVSSHSDAQVYLGRLCDAAWSPAEVAAQADPAMMWSEAEEYAQRTWFLPAAAAGGGTHPVHPFGHPFVGALGGPL